MRHIITIINCKNKMIKRNFKKISPVSKRTDTSIYKENLEKAEQ